MDMRNLTLIILLLLLALSFCGGGYAAYSTYEPEVVVQTEYIYVERPPVVVEVEREVQVLEERIIEERVPVNLKNFDSVEELIEWLAEDRTDQVPSTFRIGDVVVKLYCGDYARMLQERAMEDGYLVNVQVFSKGTKLPMSSKVLEKAHAMNTAIVENELWLIEPTTDECWMAYKVKI